MPLTLTLKKGEKVKNKLKKLKERKQKTKWHPTPDTGIGKTATLYSLCFSIREFPLSDTTKSTGTKSNRYCAL